MTAVFGLHITRQASKIEARNFPGMGGISQANLRK